MSKAVVDRMRRARERAIKSEGKTFTVRRPTVAETVSINAAIAGGDQMAYLHRCIVGWDLTPGDLNPGEATDIVAPFDSDEWREWIDDNPAHWVTLQDAITEMLSQFAERTKEAEKK